MNKFISQQESLCFDDVLCIPRLSLISRKTALLEQKVAELDLNHPVIPANMDSIVSKTLLEKQIKSKSIAIAHRYLNAAERIQLWIDLQKSPLLFISIGVTDDERSMIDNFYSQGIRNYCIDIAHGHSIAIKDTIEQIRHLDEKHKHVNVRGKCKIIAGNVCTVEGYKFLMDAGADIVKVGIGPSTVCSTRIITGCGFPQLAASLLINEWRNSLTIPTPPIILDGGFKRSGDIVKGLVSGAELIMTGTLMAGCEDSPKINGKNIYRGMSSHDARTGWFGENDHVSEGESIIVPAQPAYEIILDNLLAGIRSGMSYLGCKTIKELVNDVKFVRISNNTLVENSIRHI